MATEPDDREPIHTDRVEFEISVRTVALTFTLLILVLVVTGAIANWSIYHVAPHPDHPVGDVLKRFDLGHEPSIPAFYSASMMVICAMLLALVARYEQRMRHKDWGYWWLLAVGFLAMALDEAVMFHEMLTAAVNSKIATSGPLYFAWVLPGAVIVIGSFICLIGFLWRLDRTTRYGFLVAGALFVSGAIGMELVAGMIFTSAGSDEAAVRSLAHVISQAVEEGLEMTGIAFFLVTLLQRFRQQRWQLRFSFSSGYYGDQSR